MQENERDARAMIRLTCNECGWIDEYNARDPDQFPLPDECQDCGSKDILKEYGV